MTTNAVEVATSSGLITGFAASGQPGKPLVVLIPGGSYNAHYFDVPGHSLVEAAQDRGFAVAALNRPGYSGSTPVEGPTRFAANAEVLAGAIGELWKQYAETAPGVVLVGHSMGGAIALHMAAQPATWPLLGVSATAIHVDAPEGVAEAWNAIPDGAVVDFSDEQRVQFMYGPPDTYDQTVVGAASKAAEGIPVEELREVVDGWVSDFNGIAASIEVPIHYALAEHDHLWVASRENVRSFTDSFTHSAATTGEFVEGVGHNIDHHHGSAAFHQRQLDFAESLSTAGSA